MNKENELQTQIFRILKYEKFPREVHPQEHRATFKLESKCVKWKCNDAEHLEIVYIDYRNKNYTKRSRRTQNPKSRTLIKGRNELNHE